MYKRQEKIEADEVSLINTSKGEEGNGDDDVNGAFNDNPDEDGTNTNDDQSQVTDNTNDGEPSNSNDNPDATEGSGEGDNQEDKTNNDKPTSEEESPTAGEDGELYTESVRVKYHTELYKNLVYRVKNSVSKYVYNSLANGEDVNERTKLSLAIASYGIITFGYLLDYLNVMGVPEYASRAEAVLSYSKEGEGDI